MTQGIDTAAQANAGQHILQHAPVRCVIENIVGGDRRHARARGHSREIGQALHFIGSEAPGQREISAVAEVAAQLLQQNAQRLVRIIAQRDQKLAFAMLQQVLIAEMALALIRAAFAHRQHARQAAISGAVTGITQQAFAACQVQAAADHQLYLRLSGGVVGFYDPRKRVAVGDAHGAMPQRRRRRHHVPRM